jgi:hypothetical protein
MEEQEIDLPPLPESDFTDNGDVFGHELTTGYTADQMQAYASAAVLSERERCARILDECAAQAYERNAMRENVMWVSLAADMRSGK